MVRAFPLKRSGRVYQSAAAAELAPPGPGGHAGPVPAGCGGPATCCC
jgi:hypothetical protein